MADMVNRPPHYTKGGIETIDYLRAKMTPEQFEGFLVGNILKYVSRYGDKNGLEDLRKARWYLDRLIEMYEQFEIPKTHISDGVSGDRPNSSGFGVMSVE